MKRIINKIYEYNFNKKWEGREVNFCPLLFSSIVFWKNKVTSCGSHTKDPENGPVLYEKKLDKFGVKKFLRSLDSLMEKNQIENSPCGGCNYLNKIIVPKLEIEGLLSGVVVNNFTVCNSRCVYCNVWRDKKNDYYKLLPILKKIKKDGLLSNAAQISWGGGEPVLSNSFKELVSFGIENKYHQIVNSTGIIYSEEIVNGLRQDLISLQISPDAGTPETYFKVKGQKCFDIVWKNIKKYCEFAQNVSIKYILFSLNANSDDVEKFIKKCVESGVHKIIISAEWRSNWEYDSTWKHGTIGENEIKMAGYMNYLAQKNNIEVEISSIWSEDNINKIHAITKDFMYNKRN